MLQRVLHIIGRMDRAGAETLLMNLYRETDRNRFQFDFVYFSDDRCDYDDEIEALGGEIYRIATKNPIARFLRLYSLLSSRHWHIVHSHTLLSSSLHLSAARLARVPHLVAHAHSTQDDHNKKLVGRLYQRFARWLLSHVSTHQVACGSAAADYLFPGRRDVVLIPNAVDIELFAQASESAIRKELKIRENQLVILQVARFMPVKNHAHTISIAIALRHAGVDFRMLLVGSGPEQKNILKMLRKHTLDDNVQLLGMRTDIPELMAVANVMLLPSLYEGFPVVLVEAQASGLPAVVASSISQEVDLGLGIVSFVSLNATIEEWATIIKSSVNIEIPCVSERKKVLTAAGFSAVAGAKRLEEVYKTA